MLDAAVTTQLHPRQQAVAHACDPAPQPSGSRPVWCVVATKPKAERRAHAALHRRGFVTWLPLVTTRRRDRSWHTHALWPGYVFVQIRLDRPWNPIRYCPGVFSLLSVDGIPSVCQDHVVAALQSALDGAGAFPATEPPWKPGTPCSVLLGPANGMLDAVVLEVRGSVAHVSILMFGHLREVAVQLDALAPRD